MINMPFPNRSLTVAVDDETVAEGCRIHLQARSAMILCPCLCQAEILNLSDSSFHRLLNGQTVSVSYGISQLSFGEITDVIQRQLNHDSMTVVSFAPGLSLWEAPVSLSVPAGLSVSNTILQILAATGNGYQLISYTGDDPYFSRGQTFHGRAADAIFAVLSAAGLSDAVYWTPKGICVRSDPEETVTIPELLEPPKRTAGGYVFSVQPSGWNAGQAVRFGEITGLIREIAMDLDNVSGPWTMELLVR